MKVFCFVEIFNDESFEQSSLASFKDWIVLEIFAFVIWYLQQICSIQIKRKLFPLRICIQMYLSLWQLEYRSYQNPLWIATVVLFSTFVTTCIHLHCSFEFKFWMKFHKQSASCSGPLSVNFVKEQNYNRVSTIKLSSRQNTQTIV